MDRKFALVDGIRGMDAAHITKLLLDTGYFVVGGDRRVSSPSFWRLEELEILNHPNFKLETFDILDYHNVCQVIEKYSFSEIYHLAAQSHVGTSFKQPHVTTEINYIGTLNILEAVKNYSRETKIYNAVTSEMFGKVLETPQNETTPFNPVSPYAIAKLATYYLVRMYRDQGLFACNGILFNHTGILRSPEFITRKITMKVAEMFKAIQSGVEIKPLILGNLESKRDFTSAKDMVRGMYTMLQQDTPDDYVLASGKTITMLELVNLAFKSIGIELEWFGKKEDMYAVNKENKSVMVKISKEFYRENEVDLLLGDASKAKKVLGWEPTQSLNDIIKEMVEADIRRLS